MAAGPTFLSGMNDTHDFLLSGMAISADIILVAGRAWQYLSNESNVPNHYIVLQDDLTTELARAQQIAKSCSDELRTLDACRHCLMREVNTKSDAAASGMTKDTSGIVPLEQEVITMPSNAQ